MFGLRCSVSVLIPLGMVLAVNPTALAPLSLPSNEASTTSTSSQAHSLGTLLGDSTDTDTTGSSFPTVILPSCDINACGIDYISGSLLWWPEATTTRNPSVPVTTVFSGTPLTSPTVYLAYHSIGLILPNVSLPITIPGITIDPNTLPISVSTVISDLQMISRRALKTTSHLDTPTGGGLLTGISITIPGLSTCTADASLFKPSGLVPFASEEISQFLVPMQYMTIGLGIAVNLPATSKLKAPVIYSNLANCEGVTENESTVYQTISGTVAAGDRCFPKLVVPPNVAEQVPGWKLCGGGLWEIHDPPRPLHPEPPKNTAIVSHGSPPPKPTPAKPKPTHQPGTAVFTSSSGSPTAPAGVSGGGSSSSGNTGNGGSGSNNGGSGSGSSSGNGGGGGGSGSSNNGGGGVSGGGSSGGTDGSSGTTGGSSGGGTDGSSGTTGGSSGGGNIIGGGQSPDGDQPPPAQDPSEPAGSGLAIGSLPLTVAAGSAAPVELIGPSMTITAGGAAMTIGGSLVSLGSSEMVVGSQTVTAGGAAVTIGGSVVSMGSSMLVVGSQTETFGSEGYAMPTIATGAGAKTAAHARIVAIGALIWGCMWTLV